MAIVGGSEWKCVVLDRRHDWSAANLALYVQADLACLLRSVAVTRENRERSGCSHFFDRTLGVVACRWICGHAPTLWRGARALKFSKYRYPSARSGFHMPNYGNHNRDLRPY